MTFKGKETALLVAEEFVEWKIHTKLYYFFHIINLCFRHSQCIIVQKKLYLYNFFSCSLY